MNEQNNPILEVKNLRVSYHTYAGEVKAVRGVQFSLEKGQALAIVGESGCGKSVTAKSIMGLIKAPQGEIKENSEILYHGENILKYNKKQWQHYKGILDGNDADTQIFCKRPFRRQLLSRTDVSQ